MHFLQSSDYHISDAKTKTNHFGNEWSTTNVMVSIEIPVVRTKNVITENYEF